MVSPLWTRAFQAQLMCFESSSSSALRLSNLSIRLQSGKLFFQGGVPFPAICFALKDSSNITYAIPDGWEMFPYSPLS